MKNKIVKTTILTITVVIACSFLNAIGSVITNQTALLQLNNSNGSYALYEVLKNIKGMGIYLLIAIYILAIYSIFVKKEKKDEKEKDSTNN